MQSLTSLKLQRAFLPRFLRAIYAMQPQRCKSVDHGAEHISVCI